MNFDLKMEEMIKTIECGSKLLLHACCAPCSSSVLERLGDFFSITILYKILPTGNYKIVEDTFTKLYAYCKTAPKKWVPQIPVFTCDKTPVQRFCPPCASCRCCS